jgi:YfiH family protein
MALKTDTTLTRNRAPLLRAASLAALPWLRHGFTTRAGGVSTIYGRPDDLNLGMTKEDDRDMVLENRRILVEAACARDHAEDRQPAWPLVSTRQIHSATILTLNEPPPAPLEPADGLTTQVPSLLLAILTADCVPVLLADVRHRAVGVFHAGWRGTVARIVEQGVGVMQNQHGSDPADLLAAIGPSIGPCCYEVGEEVTQSFYQAFSYAPNLFADQHLDLWQANRRQLLAGGIPKANITTLAQCTACTREGDGSRRFFSHRAEHGVTGRMMSVAGIEPAVHPLP